jgi:hypothetical protein
MLTDMGVAIVDNIHRFAGLLFKQSQMGNKTHGRDSFHPHLHADRR